MVGKLPSQPQPPWLPSVVWGKQGGLSVRDLGSKSSLPGDCVLPVSGPQVGISQDRTGGITLSDWAPRRTEWDCGTESALETLKKWEDVSMSSSSTARGVAELVFLPV